MKYMQIAMGPVHLLTAHLERLTEFYQSSVGLEKIRDEKKRVELGYAGDVLLILEEDTVLPPWSPRNAGLYHTAFLFHSQPELARTLRLLLLKHRELFVGSADHLVSEAFYFNDPDGNGIEIYSDRDPSLWKWENGMVQMASEYIDPETYIHRHASTQNTSLQRQIGHIHLQVGDIELARKFYVEQLGLTLTADLGTALFLSDGKYHHHIGLNVWRSFGAKKVTPSLGLKNFTLHLDTTEEETYLTDPWGNHIILQPKESA